MLSGVLHAPHTVSHQQLWEWAGGVRSWSQILSGKYPPLSLGVHPGMNVGSTQKMKISVFLINWWRGAPDQSPTCILLQCAGLVLLTLLNRLQSPLSSALSYNCRVSCGLELLCSKVWGFLLAFFFPFYTRISDCFCLASAHRIGVDRW